MPRCLRGWQSCCAAVLLVIHLVHSRGLHASEELLPSDAGQPSLWEAQRQVDERSKVATAGVRRRTGAKQRSAPPPAAVRAGLSEDGCLTYEQRYARAHLHHMTLHSSAAANSQHPHSRFVVLMTLHMAFEETVPLDLILYLRSAALELTHAGYHFYILLQISNNRDLQHKLTREEMLEFLPLDLRPFVVMLDQKDALNSYPLIRDSKEKNWGPGPRASYLPVTHFMQQYEAYEYAWIIEYDVRWTGQSLASFFNAVLSLAQQATEVEVRTVYRDVRMDRPASADLPTTYDGIPDFLTFDDIHKSEKWRPATHNMGEFEELYEHYAILYFGSRKLFNAVHRRSSQGQGAHVEGFLASVAIKEGMKAASIPLKALRSDSLFNCCLEEASTFYTNWFKNYTSCHSGHLLHPVKLKGNFWPHSANLATAHQHLALAQS